MNFSKLIPSRSLVLVLGLLGTLIIGCIIFWQITPVILALLSLPKFAGILVTETGLNYWIALPITIIFAAIMLVGFKVVVRRGSRHKIIKFVLLCFALVACYSLTIFGMQQQKMKNKKEEAAAVAENLGKELKTFKKIQVSRNTIYFEPSTGKPIVFFYLHPNGKIDLFGGPGVHPNNGMRLQAITSDTVSYINDLFARGIASQMINNDTAVVQKPPERSASAQPSKPTKRNSAAAQRTEVAKESSVQTLIQQGKEMHEKLASILATERQEPTKKGGDDRSQ